MDASLAELPHTCMYKFSANTKFSFLWEKGPQSILSYRNCTFLFLTNEPDMPFHIPTSSKWEANFSQRSSAVGLTTSYFQLLWGGEQWTLLVALICSPQGLSHSFLGSGLHLCFFCRETHPHSLTRQPLCIWLSHILWSQSVLLIHYYFCWSLGMSHLVQIEQHGCTFFQSACLDGVSVEMGMAVSSL